MPYFKQLEVVDKTNMVDKKKVNQAKLDGRFEVKINRNLSPDK